MEKQSFPGSILSRRHFLQLSGLALAGLFTPASLRAVSSSGWQDQESSYPQMIGRVANLRSSIYTQPDLASSVLGKLARDRVFTILEAIHSPAGPAHNPRWYKVLYQGKIGYVYSGRIQRVDGAHLNAGLPTIPPSGVLGEVTIPFTQAQFLTRSGAWWAVYRLYYGSVHWITGLAPGPDGEMWYGLVDEWLRIKYYVPTSHLRVIPAGDYEPFSPPGASEPKRLEVSLQDQTLTAYEGNQEVFACQVSTGKRYMETPRGEFRINLKAPSKHMGDGGLTNDLRAY